VTSNFHITSGAGGTVEITDPLAAQAQGGIAFGAATITPCASDAGSCASYLCSSSDFAGPLPIA
jgi:hypothetical protein